MANEITWNEASPGDTDDVQEGAQRIRETKKAVKERFNRDHFIAGASDPAAMASTSDTGYHRRVTIQEQADNYNPASRVATIKGGSYDHSEIYVKDTDAGGSDQELMMETTVGSKTIVSTTQTQTLTNKTLTTPVLTNPVISGGSGAIDGVSVGTTTPAAGKFTTLESTGTATIGNEAAQGSSFAHDTPLTDRINLKAEVDGDTKTYTGAGKMYAGITGEIKMFVSNTAPAGWLNCDGAQYLKTAYPELFAIIGSTYAAATGGSNANSPSTSLYFRVPDMRGRVPIGQGAGKSTSAGELSTDALTTRTLGDYYDSETTSLTQDQSGVKDHKHMILDPGHNHHAGDYKYFLRRDVHTNTATGFDTEGTALEPNLDNAQAAATNYLNPDERVVPGGEEADGWTHSGHMPSHSTYDENGAGTGSAINYGAAAPHTNMQPSTTVNYIIKY